MKKLNNYSFIQLPDVFTVLLRSNMQSTGSAFIGLQDHISENRGFNQLVNQVFKDIDPNLKVKKIINALGWIGFRDRITASYLHYLNEGNFPNSPDLSIIKDVLYYEEALKNYSVDGFSRGYLLGMYRKFQSLETGTKADLTISPETFELLDLARAKVVKIDWVIILLEHFKERLGFEELKEKLTEGVSYETLFTDIGRDSAYEMVGKLLSYGASISEAEPFYSRTI